MHKSNKIKVAFFLNLIPHYREGLYDNLFLNQELDIHIFTHRSPSKKKFKTLEDKYKNVTILSLFKFPFLTVFFSFLPILSISKSNFDVFVIEGNPRYLHHFFLATYLMLFRKKIILWTMANTPSSGFTQRIRLSWTKLFKNILVYTEHEVNFLKQRDFLNHNLLSVNNGLSIAPILKEIEYWDSDRLESWKHSQGLSKQIILLSCARLEEKNRFNLGIQATKLVREKVPNLKYIIIGDGPQFGMLDKLISDLSLKDTIELMGPIHSERELAPIFLSASLMIHPGSIGLSILHAFSYGLPVITSDNLKIHAPEFTLLNPNKNGDVFKDGSIEELASTIEKWLIKIASNDFHKEIIQSISLEKHNTDIMALRLFKIIKSTLKN